MVHSSLAASAATFSLLRLVVRLVPMEETRTTHKTAAHNSIVLLLLLLLTHIHTSTHPHIQEHASLLKRMHPWLVLGMVVTMIAVSVFELVDLFTAASIVAGVLCCVCVCVVVVLCAN